MNARANRADDATEYEACDGPAMPPVSTSGALENLVELAMLTCGASSGFIQLIDTGRARLEAVRGDPTRIDIERCQEVLSAAEAGATSVAIWQAATTDDGAPARENAEIPRFHVLAPLVRASGERVGAVCVVDGSQQATQELRRALELLARQALYVLDMTSLSETVAHRHDDCPSVDSRVVEARAAEGRRVTAELHAMLGHELSSAALALNAALPNLTGPRSCLGIVRAVADLLQGAVGRCREHLHAGYSADPSAGGFAKALRKLGASVARQEGLKVHVHVASDVPQQLTVSSAYHLQRIAVDAIVGAVRHSRGSTVVVSINTEADTIVLRVDDDGIAPGLDDLRERRGVRAIEAVAQMLGGDMRLRRRRPHGMSVQVRLPRSHDRPVAKPRRRPDAVGRVERSADRATSTG
jgi:signal transduction histidine kinase